MGKAKHPHDPERPESPAVKKALLAEDMDALRSAFTVRQLRFCEEYVLDFNGRASAIRAGYAIQYADRQAHLLLKNKGISTYIDYLTMSVAAKQMAVNPDWVIQGIVAVVNKEGGRDGDKLRGYELIARILGMFIERQEITGKDGEAIQIEQRKIDEEAAAFTNMLNAMRNKNKKEVHVV